MEENVPELWQYDGHIRKIIQIYFLCIFINYSQMCRLAYVCGGNSMGEDACKQVYLQNSIVWKIPLPHWQKK